jgi:cytochrome P450
MYLRPANVDAPVVDLDPFDDDFLRDPYAHHDALRDPGPVVWLDRYGIFGMARHKQVSAALKDWKTFCSGRGVGLSDFAVESPWRPPSLLLEADPPLHDRTRAVVSPILSVATLQALRPQWEMLAESLIESLVKRETFDAVSDLAEVFPLQVFPDAVGVQEHGRENLLPYGALAFNAFGPRNRLTEEAMARAAPVAAWVAESCKRANLRPGGFGMAVFDAADHGAITEDEAERLVRSFLTAGVDTTVNGIGNMIAALATHADQWRQLREKPELSRRAFEEALRWDSPVQTFFRTTTRAVEIEGVVLPEGSKVLLFLAAANRDPRQWENPDRFDLNRRTLGHVGFGAGIHACVGQAVARQELELVLNALVRRVARIELAGEPRRRLNNTLHAWGTFPVRVQAY